MIDPENKKKGLKIMDIKNSEDVLYAQNGEGSKRRNGPREARTRLIELHLHFERKSSGDAC
jgi:hypothetical protein